MFYFIHQKSPEEVIILLKILNIYYIIVIIQVKLAVNVLLVICPTKSSNTTFLFILISI